MNKNQKNTKPKQQTKNEFYRQFSYDDTRHYGLFLKKGYVNVDPKRLIKEIDGALTEEQFAAMSQRNTRYFTPLKRKQTDYFVYLFLNELENIKNEWLREYKPLIDERLKGLKPQKYVAGDDALLHMGLTSVASANFRATMKTIISAQKARIAQDVVIASMYAQFFHQAAAQLEAITVKVLFLRNVKVKGSFRNTFEGSVAGSGVYFEDITGIEYHQKLYRIWNFIKHNNEDTYNKLKRDFPDVLYPFNYIEGDLAIHYVKFGEELFTDLYKGLKAFYRNYCRDVCKETVFDSTWNYDEYFKKIVYDHIKFVIFPDGSDGFDID